MYFKYHIYNNNNNNNNKLNDSWFVLGCPSKYISSFRNSSFT